jgi:hypothetical protein
MTTSTIAPRLKAIETFYKGHRFRSRLEARWAVFFDALGLRWEYEVEGYELPDGTRYLPDFKLITPQGNYRWVEIKPSDVTADLKFSTFARAVGSTGIEAMLVSGSPLHWLGSGYSVCPRCGVPAQSPWDEHLDCWPCDMETPGGGDHAWEHNGVQGTAWRPHKGSVAARWDDICELKRLVKRAATKAQGARFEFGEEG